MIEPGILFTVALAFSARRRARWAPFPALYRFSSCKKIKKEKSILSAWVILRWWNENSKFINIMWYRTLLYSSSHDSSSQAAIHFSTFSRISFLLKTSSLALQISDSIWSSTIEGLTAPIHKHKRKKTSGNQTKTDNYY